MATPRRIQWIGTYIVPNNIRKEEIARLTIEDEMLTAGMGGPLAEQAAPEVWRDVLDIGCGIGDWAIQAVVRYPAMLVLGIDMNRDTVEVAQARARTRHMCERATYQVMDALEPLEFANDSFDLVNMRLGSTFLRIWDWPPLLSEIVRVLRPGGVVRLTEVELAKPSSGLAHSRYFELMLLASFNAGHLFALASDGLTGHLPRLLTHHGLQNVQSQISPLTFESGTPAGKVYSTYFQHSHTLLYFLQKWASQPYEIETIYRHALAQTQQKGFRTTWNIHTVWGRKP